MFSDIFPDPALLFRFKIAVHRLPDIENLADFDHWGFETRHQMPPIDRLGGQHTPILAKIGWNPQGLFLEIGVDLLARKKEILGIYVMQLILKVNSRYNPGLLRENEFCSIRESDSEKPPSTTSTCSRTWPPCGEQVAPC